MPVLCPFCGKTSEDAEFCDHCNSDLRSADPSPPSRCPIGDKHLELTDEQRRKLSHPEAYLVIQDGGQRWRLHWLGPSREWKETALQRAAQTSHVLPPVRVVEAENGAWVFGEVGRETFAPWRNSIITSDPMRETERLLGTLHELADAFGELHRLGCVCLNFDPTEFDRDKAGRIRFTGFDVRTYPAGRILEHVTIRNSFAAPEIVAFREAAVGVKSDVFHVALFAYCWLARLLPHGFPGAGLEAFRYALPPLRTYCPQVPEGISAVLRRGTAPEQSVRFGTVAELCDAFQSALDRAKARRAFSGPVRYEIGADSRVGRTKAALNKPNEDHALVRPVGADGAMLVAVADGITTCDVGSGELASLFATLRIEQAFDGSSRREEFADKIKTVCRQGAELLLDWAIDKGYGDQLALGVDLMGTTLTVAWLEGPEMEVANLGDSRAYLIDGSLIEQLTVDGDLASDLLARRRPPEEIQQMGSVSRALRVCIGGCTLTPEGKPAILEDACQPTMSRWRFMPGDVLVFCTDGLVEEGAFLEPEMVAQIIREHPTASSQELAERLSDAADRCQRVPSAMEPEGFGDNVTCVVVRVNDGASQAPG
ncbi:MAG: protein phosphatase 2C domain-containing protein [Gemmataceae bacterium]|nr:protein phosphatase 2C domain-containing protein [Gemmataceae bacterium]